MKLIPLPEGDLPGKYPETARMLIGYEGISKVTYTVNDLEPVVSEYITYDTLNPPNPFIAVTQDGRGNVLYDGGFPKLYNGSMPSGTTFQTLSGSFKYFANALEWISNTEKVSEGNRNILILGDSNVGESYSIKGTEASGFYNSLEKLATVGNWQFTYRTASDYSGNRLDIRTNELDNYVAVVILSSIYSSGPARITDNCVTDIVSFRNKGNGLLIITDHGPVLNSLEEARNNSSGFFNMANRISVNFGAWFSGDYNRTPVNVGWIRSNYGDHPLYNNLTDEEHINAGGSESRVFVNEDLYWYETDQLIDIVFNVPGINTVNFLVTNEQGHLKTFKYTYLIGDVEIINFMDEQGEVIKNKHDLGIANVFRILIKVQSHEIPGTLEGTILRNLEPVGTFTYTETEGFIYNWVNPTENVIRFNDGDTFKIVLDSPLTYTEYLEVNRIQPDWKNKVSFSEMVSSVNSIDLGNDINLILKNLFNLIQPYEKLSYSVSNSKNISSLKNYFKRI